LKTNLIRKFNVIDYEMKTDKDYTQKT